MNLPLLLQQLEQGSISVAQAEQEIRDEIERIRDKQLYGDIDPTGNYQICWMGGIDCLKAALGLLMEIEK